MTTIDALSQQLLDLTAEQLSVAPAQLVRDASLAEDLGLDSLAAIEWGMASEDAFGPTGITSYFAGSRDLITVTAVERDTSCSALRPPNSTITRSRLSTARTIPAKSEAAIEITSRELGATLGCRPP